MAISMKIKKDYEYDDLYIKTCVKIIKKEEDISNLYHIIKVIVEHEKWQEIAAYPHHNQYNRGEHLLRVACYAYLWSLSYQKCDSAKVAIAGVLHDFFPYDWMEFETDIFKVITALDFKGNPNLISKKIKHYLNDKGLKVNLTDQITKFFLNGKRFKPNFFGQHAFIHPLISLINAYKFFPDIVDNIVGDAIYRHMWPLNGLPIPQYKESWLVWGADKIESHYDVLGSIRNSPSRIFELPTYIGIKTKKSKDFIKK